MKRPTAPASASIAPAASPGRPTPALPAWKAFVVQFSSETAPGAGAFTGRVEHLSSGRRSHFNSADELVAVLRKLLDGVTPPIEE